ncbi:MAG: hypothetical protein RR263_05775, partial [Oscillospiraceae bacterium]
TNIIDIYHNENKANVTESYVTEYTLTRKNINAMILCRDNYDTYKAYSDIRWCKDKVELKNLRAIKDIPTNEFQNANETIKITSLHNYKTKTYTVWLNNKLVQEDLISINNEKGNTHTRIYCETAGQQFSIDDFHSYTVDTTVLEDAKALAIGYATGEDAQNVKSNITLPIVGINGNAITWESSNTALIDNNGVVTQILNDHEVKLTATITSATEVRSAEFTVTVLSLPQDYVALDLPKLTKDSLMKVKGNPEELIIDSLELPSKGASGRTNIVWEISDSTIITADGTLKRPA